MGELKELIERIEKNKDKELIFELIRCALEINDLSFLLDLARRLRDQDPKPQ